MIDTQEIWQRWSSVGSKLSGGRGCSQSAPSSALEIHAAESRLCGSPYRIRTSVFREGNQLLEAAAEFAIEHSRRPSRKLKFVIRGNLFLLEISYLDVSNIATLGAAMKVATPVFKGRTENGCDAIGLGT